MRTGRIGRLGQVVLRRGDFATSVTPNAADCGGRENNVSRNTSFRPTKAVWETSPMQEESHVAEQVHTRFVPRGGAERRRRFHSGSERVLRRRRSRTPCGYGCGAQWKSGSRGSGRRRAGLPEARAPAGDGLDSVAGGAGGATTLHRCGRRRAAGRLRQQYGRPAEFHHIAAGHNRGRRRLHAKRNRYHHSTAYERPCRGGERSAAPTGQPRRLRERISLDCGFNPTLAAIQRPPRDCHDFRRHRRASSFGVSNPYVDSAVQKAQQNGIVIFAIYTPGFGRYYRSYWRMNMGQIHLSQISDETGGEAYFLGFQAPVSYTPYLDDIGQRLRHQYLLTFAAPAHNKPRLVPVRLRTEVPNAELIAADQAWVGTTAGGR